MCEGLGLGGGVSFLGVDLRVKNLGLPVLDQFSRVWMSFAVRKKLIQMHEN